MMRTLPLLAAAVLLAGCGASGTSLPATPSAATAQSTGMAPGVAAHAPAISQAGAAASGGVSDTSGCVSRTGIAPAFSHLPSSPAEIPYALPSDLGSIAPFRYCRVGQQHVSSDGYQVTVGMTNSPDWPFPNSVPVPSLVAEFWGSRSSPARLDVSKMGAPVANELIAGHTVTIYASSTAYATPPKHPAETTTLAVTTFGAFTVTVLGGTGKYPQPAQFSTDAVVRGYLAALAKDPPAPGATWGEIDYYGFGSGAQPSVSASWTYDGDLFYSMMALGVYNGIPILHSIVRPASG